MAFNLLTFEAEAALKLIPTEKLPACAQDAMEAGNTGPAVVRMAILNPQSGWEIDQVLPKMLAELGCRAISPEEAALRLARIRAEQILANNEDPLSSLSYFYQLMWTADYPNGLLELGYLEDELCLLGSLEERRSAAREAVENFLGPELGRRRHTERQAEWTRRAEEAKRDWPYVFNSPGRRALMKQHLRDMFNDVRLLPWHYRLFLVLPWLLLGFSFGWWKFAMIGLLAYPPLLLALAYSAVYQKLKRERRDILLRCRVPEDQI